MERSSGPDTELITNINPGYLGAVYFAGAESVLLLVLCTSPIENRIKPNV